MEISSNYFYFDDKEYMVSLCRDITERKRAEEALRESEKKYRSLVEQVNDWVWEIDANGIYTYASPRVRGLLGYEPGEMIGTSPFDYMAPEELERVKALFDPVFEAQEEFSLLENKLVKKDGGMVTVETSGVPIFDAHGTFTGYRGIDRDITERKRAEEALQESEEKYRIVADNTYDWEFWLSPEGQVVYTSPSCERITGLSAGELTKNPGLLFEITHPEDKPAFLAHIHAQQPSTHSELEFRIVSRNGEVRWIHHICQPVYDRDGRFLGNRGSNRDITERKRAEEAIIRSEKMLQLVMDNIPHGIFWKDRNSTYLGCNKVIAQAAGLRTPRDILGKTDYDLPWSREQADFFRAYDRKVMENDAPEYHIVEQLREASGRVAWLETNKVPLHDAKGNVTGILGTYEDITERKRAEETIMLAGAYNRSLIESSLDPLVTISPDGVITDVNKATEAVTGYSREKLINTDFSDYFTEPDKAKEGYLTAFKQGSVTDYALEIRHKDGHIIPVIYNASVYRDEAGKVIGVFAAARDITERRRAEEALKKSEANLDRAQRIASLGNWEWDLKTNQLSGSQEYYRMFGFEHQRPAPFEKFASMLHPDDRKWVDDVIKDIHYDNLPRSYEFRLLLPDGRERYIHSIVEVIYDENGRPVKVFGTMQDITERKQAENALQDAKDQVELYVDLMGHDINNMNQVSMGFLELAHNIIEMEGKLGEDNIVLLDKAMDSLKNSSQLIDNVRKLQREKMGLYEPEVLDVGSVIEDAVKQFHDIPGRDVKITCTYQGHYFARANALLKDVFINLVGNAVKHSRGSLSVNIHVSQVIDNGKTYCRVDVEDDGPGIPDALKDALFNRLNLTTTRAKGKGFGLCLIKMLVDDYKGIFWVEDRVPGDHTKGARFVVMLPAVEK